MDSQNNQIKIGSLMFDLQANQVLYGGLTSQVEPRLVDVLSFLYQNQGRVVERDAINSKVWHGQVISDNALNRSISQLRKLLALAESPQPTIETIPKVGYRLVIPESNNSDEEQDVLSRNDFKKGKSQSNKVDYTITKVIMFSVFTLIVFVSYVYEKYLSSVDEVKFIQSTLTHSPGVEKLARFSPDGKSIAFVQVDQKKGEEFIYLLDVETRQTKSLTHESKYILSLAWSPDSNKIIYSHWNNIHERECGVSLLALDGYSNVTEENQVLNCSERSLIYLAWDQKSKKIYFNERESFDRPYAVYSYSLISKRITQLTLPKQEGNFKGDYFVVGNLLGTRIAIVRYLATDRLRLMIYDTENGELITSNLISEKISSITWFGSQEKLLSVIDKQLHLYELSNNSFQPFYFIGKNSSSINTDINAKRIVFTQSKVDLNLHSYDLLTEKKIADITKTTSNELMPSFANNSNSIAYLSNQSGKFQVWLTDENGKHNKVSYSPASLGLTPLKWSPDDRQILFQHEDEIFTLNIANKNIKRIIDITHKSSVANWSTNGESIFYSSEKSGEWQIWRYDISNGKHQQVTMEGGYSANQHPNGDLYVSRIHQSGLWKLPVDLKSKTGFSRAEHLFAEFDGTNWLSWQISGDLIYYFSIEASEQGLFEYNTITSERRLVFPFTDKHRRYFSVKNTTAIFTIAEDAEGSIELLSRID